METRKYMPQEFPRIRNQYFWEHFLSWNVTLLRGGIPVVAFEVNSMSLVSLTHQRDKVQTLFSVCWKLFGSQGIFSVSTQTRYFLATGYAVKLLGQGNPNTSGKAPLSIKHVQ